MLHVGDHKISLDRKESGSTVDFISHAHTDHISAAKRSNSILASAQTIDLLGALGINASLSSGFLNAELMPAGHILGSRQLYVNDEDKGTSYLYSGDFQMQESAAAESIKTRNADVLIIDSTYPNPGINFGIKDDIISDVQSWVASALNTGCVLFSAYAMGKAQELIAVMNEIGIMPVVTKKISTISSVYRKNGISLRYVSAYDGSDYEDILNGDFVGISEQRDINELAYRLQTVHKKKFHTAVVTGFASFMHFDTDAQFNLSDHADFAQSVDYINEVSPKQILTYGHNAERFAANLSKFGYNATPFSQQSFMFAKQITAMGQKQKTKEYIY
ncbi:MAG: hypothetical protein M1279_01615 [Candidatus Marsarchaeota archaeon]|nr:hypothetical protein [Candidatus Marsarchaeota archaeon]MCL5122649.1 hypothetical protein [Candidatus Marsarchaeota archaeon]